MNEKDKIQINQVKSINLFNCRYKNEDLNDLIKKIKEESSTNEKVEEFRNNIEELILVKNNIDTVNIGFLCENLPNLKIINLSHNNIRKIIYEPKEVQNNINEINISFNNITDFTNIINILNSCPNLLIFKFYANPFDKFYQNLLENPSNDNINEEIKKK